MAIPDIQSLLPHAEPMVLLDRVVSVNEESLLAEVCIRPAVCSAALAASEPG